MLYHGGLIALDSGSAPPSARRRIPPWLIAAVGYAVSLACLVWVYYGFDWKTELPRFARVPWQWLAVAVITDIAVYFTQGWRWTLLLAPISRIPVWKTIQAVYIGLFANEVLPLRSGEVIRCFLQSRWSGIELPVIIASAVIERLIDGMLLMAAFFASSLFVEMPGYMVQGSRILLVVLILLSAVFGFVMYSKRLAHHAVSQSRWAEKLWHVVEGLHRMGNSRTFWWAIGASLLYLLLQVIPIYALAKGYGIDLSFWSAAVVLLVLRIGTMIPQAPGNVGSFQVFTVIALSLFGVDRDTSVGFATLLFLVVTVPLWLTGFIALIATRMRLQDIHREAHADKQPAR